MKKLLTHPVAILITLLFLAYFATIIISFRSSSVSNEHVRTDIFDYSPGDTSFGGLLYKSDINDSLPHFKYQHLTDSLNNLNEQRLQENETLFTGWHTVNIGVGKIDNHFLKGSDTNNLYFLALKEFELEDNVRFFVANNQYNLLYVAWDTVNKNGESLIRNGKYKSIKIPVRYSVKEKEIYIPISKSQFYVGNIIIPIVMFILLTLSLFVVIGYPVQFLVRISKGNAFSEKNINGLRMITILISLYIVFSILFPFLIRLLFSKYIHPFFKPINVYQLFSDKLIVLFVLAIVFAIYQAFKKGYKLQQEQELTV